MSGFDQAVVLGLPVAQLIERGCVGSFLQLEALLELLVLHD